MKTIWYWHFQRVCDMLLLSTWTASYSLSWLATPYSLYHRRLFLDILTVSTYTILPSIAGGLVLSIMVQKKRDASLRLPFPKACVTGCVYWIQAPSLSTL